MPKATKPSTQTAYRRLCRDLREILERARAEAERALGEVRNRTYWLMGKRLAAEVESMPARGLTRFLRQVAREVGVSQTVLSRALRFYLAFPAGVPAGGTEGGMSWAAHVELLQLKEPEQRMFYLEQATRNRWSARKLRRAIRNRLFESSRAAPGAPAPRLDRPRSGLHTYAGKPERVIDGDTLIVRIDLGFDVWKAQRIRLRGVDTPELGTPEGERAKEFVAGVLDGIDTVVVKTYKTDTYARYVADLFYHPLLEEEAKEDIFSRGHFLNQQLLDQGLAKKVVY